MYGPIRNNGLISTHSGMTKDKKIIFISANRHKDPYPVFPLGLSYLKTYLSEHLSDFEITIVDCNTCSQPELAELIRTQNPAYVGISLRNVDGANSLEEGNFLSGYKEIVNTVRSATKAPILIGGAGFSIFPDLFMKELNADYGLIGEGENSLLALIRALENQAETNRIGGLILPGQNLSEVKPHDEYIRSLNVCFDETLAEYYWKYSGMLNIQTKRGCPYHCIYCSYPVIDGRRVRTLDPELIADNIERMKKEKGINYFFFTDSVFNIKDSYNQELAETLIRRNLNVSWGAYFTPGNISAEKMRLYKESGLTHVEFGTESLSDAALASYGKNFTFADILKASDVCLKENIYYSHFLILGGYGETKETLRETFLNSQKIQYSVFFPFIGMRIYPFTRLHQIAVEEGFITPDNDLVEPVYYIAQDFDLDQAKKDALNTGKAWVFPDDPKGDIINQLRIKKNKKGPLWEYLRMP